MTVLSFFTRLHRIITALKSCGMLTGSCDVSRSVECQASVCSVIFSSSIDLQSVVSLPVE